jgi:hypothetical protein
LTLSEVFPPRESTLCLADVETCDYCPGGRPLESGTDDAPDLPHGHSLGCG